MNNIKTERSNWLISNTATPDKDGAIKAIAAAYIASGADFSSQYGYSVSAPVYDEKGMVITFRHTDKAQKNFTARYVVTQKGDWESELVSLATYRAAKEKDANAFEATLQYAVSILESENKKFRLSLAKQVYLILSKVKLSKDAETTLWKAKGYQITEWDGDKEIIKQHAGAYFIDKMQPEDVLELCNEGIEVMRGTKEYGTRQGIVSKRDEARRPKARAKAS